MKQIKICCRGFQLCVIINCSTNAEFRLESRRNALHFSSFSLVSCWSVKSLSFGFVSRQPDLQVQCNTLDKQNANRFQSYLFQIAIVSVSTNKAASLMMPQCNTPRVRSSELVACLLIYFLFKCFFSFRLFSISGIYCPSLFHCFFFASGQPKTNSWFVFSRNITRPLFIFKKAMSDVSSKKETAM